jgi:hypothetical protein
MLILDNKDKPRWMSVGNGQLTLSPEQGTTTHIAVIFVTGMF